MNLLKVRDCSTKSHKKCRGIGTLVFMVLIVIAVLVIFVFMQRFSTMVTRQRESLASGKRAFYMAEASINEALLDFKSKVNVPSELPDSWFRLAREKLTPSYERLARKTFIPQLTKHLYDDNDIRVEAVDVAMWSQFSINKLQYEKVGLLTFTAIVMIPRKLPGLWGKYVRRNVQKSYEFRHVLVTPPRPFDGFTFFIDKWPYLQSESDNYDKNKQRFDKGARDLSENINREMDSWKDTVTGIVDWCKDAVQKYEEAMDKIDDIKNPFVSKSEARQKAKEYADQKAKENGFRDYAHVVTVSGIAPDCWMGAAGYPWQTKMVNWPAFREGGESLDNPVYVVERQLASGQMTIEWPDTPEVPKPYPSDSLPKDTKEFTSKADWEGGLTILSSAFSSWCNKYDATLPPFEQALRAELQRHESLFKLVPNDWVDTFRKQYEVKETPAFWRGKASYVFENQAQFDKHIPRKGDTIFLDGVYFVEGALKLNFASYIGSGAIASKATIDVGNCRNAGDGCLTLASEKEIFMNGSPQAGLLAPKNCVKFSGGSLLGTASSAHYGGDEFSISYDKNMASKVQSGGDNLPRFWVTVSPYHIACNFLRN